MALVITNKCVNCGICETECPNHAIYPPAEEWKFSTGTTLEGNVTLSSGEVVSANQLNRPYSLDHFYIVSEKCTECVGFHKEQKCASVCPENCCVLDQNWRESNEVLLKKAKNMHPL